VRADISRLPFVSGSIDAVHAGAAIHCWPSPACAVRSLFELLIYVKKFSFLYLFHNCILEELNNKIL
jgi:SAM-dependent methyltransferase